MSDSCVKYTCAITPCWTNVATVAKRVLENGQFCDV